MKSLAITTLFVAGMWCVVPAAAQVIECWDLGLYSTAELAAPGEGPFSVMVVPDGTGDPLAAAYDAQGSLVDATIIYHLRDCDDLPVPNFPAEDLWLEVEDQGLASCVGGTVADAETDVTGRTTWSRPLRAGGSSQAACIIVVSGTPGIWPPYLPLQFNSPDLDADLDVDLSDLAIFAGDYFGGYRYRSDFARDGVLNLIDLVRMAAAYGAGCP
jgi:hypothetical protein